MPKHCCIKPDLSLFYNLDDNITIFSRNTFGSTIIETINGNLLNKNNNVVGRIAITNTIYDINDTNNNGLYENSSQTTLFLKKGNIQFTTAYQVTKDSQGNFIFPSGKTIYKIVSGTGIYLNAKGYIMIIANNMARKANIYFTNKK
jgi:hypothetical protein